MTAIIDTIFPLLAIFIVFFTPKGIYKTINTVLACMLIFIYGLEEYTAGLLDSTWYDATLTFLYIGMAALFYRVGGMLQFKLTFVGIVLHAGYWLGFNHNYYPLDYYYSEVFVLLTLLQLWYASDGILKPIFDQMVNGVLYEKHHRTGINASFRNSSDRDNS